MNEREKPSQTQPRAHFGTRNDEETSLRVEVVVDRFVTLALEKAVSACGGAPLFPTPRIQPLKFALMPSVRGDVLPSIGYMCIAFLQSGGDPTPRTSVHSFLFLTDVSPEREILYFAAVSKAAKCWNR
jgi:hypothetical protein